MTDTLAGHDYVYYLASSPGFHEDGIIFAAKRTGLYKSIDRGQSWRDAYESMGLDVPLPTTAIAISPDFEHDRTVFAAVEGNILRSTDGGKIWRTAELGAPPPVVTSLEISPDFARDGVIVAGTLQDGVFRSVNRGARWTGWNFALLDPNIYDLKCSPDFASDQTVYAGTETGIFQSINGGRSWREVDFSMALAPVLSLAIVDTAIYAGTEENGLFVSRDDGETWGPLAPEVDSGSIDHIFADDLSRMLIIQDGSIRTSRDGGCSWELRSGDELDSLVCCVAVPRGASPGSPILLGLQDGRVVSI